MEKSNTGKLESLLEMQPTNSFEVIVDSLATSKLDDFEAHKRLLDRWPNILNGPHLGLLCISDAQIGNGKYLFKLKIPNVETIEGRTVQGRLEESYSYDLRFSEDATKATVLIARADYPGLPLSPPALTS
jgi:hypothetical protein